MSKRDKIEYIYISLLLWEKGDRGVVDEELVCVLKHLIRHGVAVPPSPTGEGFGVR